MKFLLSALLLFSPILSAAAPTSAGLTLLQRPSARASALGEAFSAVARDVAAFHYNPAALATLDRPQASLLYEDGFAGDAFGRVLGGLPTRRGAFGLSLGYYDGGEAALSSDGFTTSQLTVQRDLLVTLGYARTLGVLEAGVAVKHLSSELIEKHRASAFAVDAGLGWEPVSGWRLAVSIQNVGGALTYLDSANALPRVSRLGTSLLVLPEYNATLFAELPYYLEEEKAEAAVGLEAGPDPLAFRLGYQAGRLKRLSLGAGFRFGDMTLDYAYSMIGDLDAAHLVSVSIAPRAP